MTNIFTFKLPAPEPLLINAEGQNITEALLHANVFLEVNCGILGNPLIKSNIHDARLGIVDFEDFVNTYKPIKNPRVDAPYGGYFIDANNNKDMRFLRKNARHVRHLWMLVVENGIAWVVSDWEREKRVGFFLTEMPRTEVKGDTDYFFSC